MGRETTIRDILGVIKDKASLSKAALLSKSNVSLSLRLAILRATTHGPPAPPDDHHLSAILSFGNSSRTTASAVITALMDRLNSTSNCYVAFKCLLIIHHIIKRGPFILQDQLSVFPATGGHNYLKLTAFRDGATAGSWVISAWVRWYARYLETLLFTSRVLGYFLSPSSNSMIKDSQEERISHVLNVDLIKDVDSLTGLIEEMCKAPDTTQVEGNVLLNEVMGLLGDDYLSAVNEILLRLGEFKKRLSSQSFGDSVELIRTLKRLENCKDRIGILLGIKKPSIDILWSLTEELKNEIEVFKVHKEGGISPSLRRENGSESARLGSEL
ncbi:putative clathrin assembly protein At4g40080 [Olea europaea var. sylvestris]|uniref:Clathrin assembly At4g40080 n=1 Tax=Olea europaea subsp. europaea TaxID=158383 RepID=A0A8S0Q5T7_OLEEU|nr:putative clathrin assembly protein At4g40080 [Olea europaea var. sylvestris]CAA2961527.1 clathrin assembly At4g40080 [Olea europaea subsp. europaea]